MIQYRRKYNSKRKHETRPWHDTFLSHTITETDWKIFDFRIDGVVYTDPSKEFKEVYSKLKMWYKLQNDTV